MAYDEGLAQRVRDMMDPARPFDERRMFGGLAFLSAGNMCCGVIGDRLMVRVGPEAYDDALAQPHASPMDFTGRPMRGMVYVTSDGLDDDTALRAWIERGVAFAGTLPPK